MAYSANDFAASIENAMIEHGFILKNQPLQAVSEILIDLLQTLNDIAGALATAETGEALVEVARNAHRAEMRSTIERDLLQACKSVIRSADEIEYFFDREYVERCIKRAEEK